MFLSEVRDKRTGQRDCHLPQLSAELSRLGLGVATLSEVRRPGSGWVSGMATPSTGQAVQRSIQNPDDLVMQPHDQMMALLPKLRLSTSLRAFANCGVNFTGPFFTQQGGRKEAKWYLAVFTCFQTCA